MSKNKNVKKAIEAIQNNDAVSLRKSIKEALVAKVRKALDKKEKQIARNLIEDIQTEQPIQEAKLTAAQIKSKREELKNLHKQLDTIFFSGNKDAYGKALKRAVQLADELRAAGINPSTGGKSGVPTM